MLKNEPPPGVEPAKLFAALGDPTRLRLVERLSSGRPQSMSSVGADMAISRQAVAKHLDILLHAGLVARTRSGREVHFALDGRALHPARIWLEAVGAQWEGTLERLRLFVETES